MPDPAPQPSPADLRALKARAHPLLPLVIVGAKGLTDAVLKEVDNALKSHELIKVKLATDDRKVRADQFATLASALGAVPVQHIGKIVTLYRLRVEAPPPPKPVAKSDRPRRAATAARPESEGRRTRPRATSKSSGPRRPVPARRGGSPGGSAPARRPRARP